MGDTGERTGYFVPEVAHVYYPLRETGIEIDFATTRAGEPRGYGDEKGDLLSERYRSDPEVAQEMTERKVLSEVDPSGYDAVYFPGGHGTMWDFPDNPEIERVVREIDARQGLVAAVCHGPAAFVDLEDAQGRPFVAGKQLAAFSDAEERRVKLDHVVPFLLETRLREQGATLSPAEDFAQKVVVDGRLITGQNPASAGPLATALIEGLEARKTAG